jgi:hypothetical protein
MLGSEHSIVGVKAVSKGVRLNVTVRASAGFFSHLIVKKARGYNVHVAIHIQLRDGTRRGGVNGISCH